MFGSRECHARLDIGGEDTQTTVPRFELELGSTFHSIFSVDQRRTTPHDSIKSKESPQVEVLVLCHVVGSKFIFEGHRSTA